VSSINDHFERVCILNLQYKENRRSRLERHLEEVGLSGNIQWIKALSGDKMPHPAWWNAGNGAWGCLLSHSKVIAEALEDEVSSLLIMEDDVILKSNAVELLDCFMAQVPGDWGQIYLGGQHIRKPVKLEEGSFVCRARCVNRTHAYAISRSAMARLFQHIWHAPDYIANPGGWHFDHQLGFAHQRGDWASYAPRWWIAGQDEDWSNISGRYNPELWWQPEEWALHLPFVIIPTSMGGNLQDDHKFLHCGNHLYQGTCCDQGLDSALSSDEKFRDWLLMIASEALELGRLPGIQHPDLQPERLEKIWQGGVLPWAPRGMGDHVAEAYSMIDNLVLRIAGLQPESAAVG
jgi:hypothetical protein